MIIMYDEENLNGTWDESQTAPRVMVNIFAGNALLPDIQYTLL